MYSSHFLWPAIGDSNANAMLWMYGVLALAATTTAERRKRQPSSVLYLHALTEIVEVDVETALSLRLTNAMGGPVLERSIFRGCFSTTTPDSDFGKTCKQDRRLKADR